MEQQDFFQAKNCEIKKIVDIFNEMKPLFHLIIAFSRENFSQRPCSDLFFSFSVSFHLCSKAFFSSFYVNVFSSHPSNHLTNHPPAQPTIPQSSGKPMTSPLTVDVTTFPRINTCEARSVNEKISNSYLVNYRSETEMNFFFQLQGNDKKQ